MMMPKAIWELGNLYLGHLPSTCGTWRENDASCQYPSLHKIILDFAQLNIYEILIFLMETKLMTFYLVRNKPHRSFTQT